MEPTSSDALSAAYDPEKFRERGKQLVDQIADYLASVQTRSTTLPVLKYRPPEHALPDWEQSFAGSGDEIDPSEWWQRLIEESIHLHHPRYMGHQISPPLPDAALAGLLADTLNNGMGVYEMGSAATVMEHVIVNDVARQFGMPKTAGGFLTSGGTLGNLTALLAARRSKAPQDVWNDGHQQKLALLVSDQAHYCVDRAARIMGMGAAGVIKVPADKQFRMKTDLLPEYWQRALDQGLHPIAVIGSACSTSTGAYDDLNAIADFCEERGTWFHVDGAHGAAAAFSARYQSLVHGMERADSVVMDFHKTLMTPALVTALIYKNHKLAYSTFSQQAEYLWNSAESEEWFELTKRTFECTKYMMSIKVYAILKTHGFDIFRQYVERCFDLGRQFAQILDQHPSFELPTEPDCNIVCFRLIDASLNNEQLNQLNRAVRRSILESGEFYIVQTELRGTVYLRVTLTNPFTELEDLQRLLETIVNEMKALSPH